MEVRSNQGRAISTGSFLAASSLVVDKHPRRANRLCYTNLRHYRNLGSEAGPLFAPRSGKCRAEFYFRAVLHPQERQTDSDANYTEVSIAFHQSFDAGDWLRKHHCQECKFSHLLCNVVVTSAIFPFSLLQHI